MDKEILLHIARQTLQDAFTYEQNLDLTLLAKQYPYLSDDGASFVTLTKDGKLRGCIGSLQAQRPLLEDIMANAYFAAFRDPRFSKLAKDELENIKIEVSVLTTPSMVEYKDIEDLKEKITPFEDGIILSLGVKRATFLPQVWEELPEFEVFFGHLLHKAGLPMDSFNNHPTIEKYQVQKFKEK